MGSIAAKKVAHEVLETIGKGQKPSVNKIAPKHGYSKSTASSGEIQATESYKSVINPVIAKWEKERDRLTVALSKKDLSKESMRDTMNAIDILTKNIQLLTGGETERNGISINFDPTFKNK